MQKRALLIEPYDLIADVISQILNDLRYAVDLVQSGDVDEVYLARTNYDCAIINLDQNRTVWHDHGLALAHKISLHKIPVIMIPDNAKAQMTIAASGWHYIEKPFTAARLATVVELATRSRKSSQTTVGKLLPGGHIPPTSLMAAAAELQGSVGELKAVNSDIAQILFEREAQMARPREK